MEMNNIIAEKIMQKVADCNFLHHLEIEITDINEGKVNAVVPLKEEYKQHQGLAHGGLITTLADSVAGFAAISVTPDENQVVTAELKISFLRAAKGDILSAKGSVIKRGRTLHFCEAEVWDNDILVAKATATMAVIFRN